MNSFARIRVHSRVTRFCRGWYGLGYARGRLTSMLLSPRFAGIVAALIFACWVRSAIREDHLDWNRNGFAVHLESCSGFIVVRFQPNDRPDAFETTALPEHFGY